MAISKILDLLRPNPQFDWIQIEVTSRCNASCSYCPATAYRENWLSRDLPLETFKKLLPIFKSTKLVYLQGWGEPFLHPDLFVMVSLARKTGCLVGTTTNGMAIDAVTAEKIVSSGLDIIAFSLAGTGEKNNTIRKGTRLDKVLDSIQLINDQKLKASRQHPVINIAYLLLRSEADHLLKLPHLFHQRGINNIVISTLDHCPPGLENEAFRNDQSKGSELLSLIERTNLLGREKGIGITFNVTNSGPSRLNTCTENIVRAVFISADGEVSPCAFTNIPVKESKIFPRTSYGNINQISLAQIWRGSEYSNFRDNFSAHTYNKSCVHCPKYI